MGQTGANLRILARNLIEELVPTAAGTGMGVNGSLPASNLALPTIRSQTCRATDTGGGLAALTFSAAVTDAVDHRVNMMAMTRTNWTPAATLAPQFFSAANFTGSVYNPGAATTPFSLAGLSLLDQAQYRSYDAAGLRNHVLYTPLFTNVRSATLALSDTANPDGYYEQTKWWLGEYFEITYDPMWGAVDMSYVDASVQGRADDGTMNVDKRYKNRMLRINLDLIVDQDLDDLLGIARYLGKDRECLIDLYPSDLTAKGIYHRGAFRLTDSPTFNPTQIGLHKNTLTFEET